MARVWNGRRQKWFFIDNEIIDNYKLSPEADSLYMKLCRHANNQNGESRPSLRKWATEKKIGWEKLKAAADELIEKNLIKVIKEEHGRPKIYVIMDMKSDSTVEPPTQKGDSTSEAPQRHSDSTSETPPPQGDSTSEHELNSIQNVKKTTKKPPDSDPQRSAPAQGTQGYQEAYKHVYQNPKDNKPVDIMKKYKDPFLKEPNPKVEAAFRKLGSLSMREENEDVADANPGYKLNCMSCGFLTEFENRDAAVDSKCKNCGKPIFEEEKNEVQN